MAVDIGGTKTLLASFTPDGSLARKHKFATPEDYTTFVELFGRELATFGADDYTTAAVAVPARLDRQAGVAIAFGNRDWERVPIRADLARFISCPIVLENDSKLAGLSEAILLRGEFRKVLYVTISTGISSALIVDGRIDPETADAETGQMLLEHSGRLMDWEDFASGRAIAKHFGKHVSDIGADEHDAWYYIARNIAIGLIDLIAVYTPEVIVLGGGVGTHLQKFQDRLDEELKLYSNPLLTIPPIRQAQRPEEAVVYGCYQLVQDQHGQVPQ